MSHFEKKMFDGSYGLARPSLSSSCKRIVDMEAKFLLSLVVLLHGPGTITFEKTKVA